jgi:hypothetical protein
VKFSQGDTGGAPPTKLPRFLVRYSRVTLQESQRRGLWRSLHNQTIGKFSVHFRRPGVECAGCCMNKGSVKKSIHGAHHDSIHHLTGIASCSPVSQANPLINPASS